MFIVLAVDPFELTIILVGFGQTKLDCQKYYSQTDAHYVRTFEIASCLGPELRTWLRSCGLCTSDTRKGIRGIGRELLKITSQGAPS